MQRPVNTCTATCRFSDASLGIHQLCDPRRCAQPLKICFLNWKMKYSVELSSGGENKSFQHLFVEYLLRYVQAWC